MGVKGTFAQGHTGGAEAQEISASVAARQEWFCGRCAAPAPGTVAPARDARVCADCGLGLLLEADSAMRPTTSDPFLVVDPALTVQAVSRAAERFFGLSEEHAINRPIRDLVVSAEAAEPGDPSFIDAILDAVTGPSAPTRHVLRPANTFGVRLPARVGPCGPPRAALIVLGREPPAPSAPAGI
jgi:PAS domain-containing protein